MIRPKSGRGKRNVGNARAKEKRAKKEKDGQQIKKRIRGNELGYLGQNYTRRDTQGCLEGTFGKKKVGKRLVRSSLKPWRIACVETQEPRYFHQRNLIRRK